MLSHVFVLKDVVTQSDEALARQLAHEEDQRQRQNHWDQSVPSHQLNVPYQPRIRKNPSTRSPQPTHNGGPMSPSNNDARSQALNPTGKDEIQKIADEFSKLAESKQLYHTPTPIALIHV